MTTELHAPALQYATPVARPPSIWAALVLSITALGLIALGGCFLMGILACHMPQVLVPNASPNTWTPGLVIFVIILYALSGICFVGAGWILFRTIRRLLQLLAN